MNAPNSNAPPEAFAPDAAYSKNVSTLPCLTILPQELTDEQVNGFFAGSFSPDDEQTLRAVVKAYLKEHPNKAERPLDTDTLHDKLTARMRLADPRWKAAENRHLKSEKTRYREFTTMVADQVKAWDLRLIKKAQASN